MQEEDSEEENPAADCNAEQEPNWDYGNPSRDPVEIGTTATQAGI